ncbi:MAG: hypothetical protein M3Q42_07905 [Pseudomonadota bacterium]|nr:hypothetical protein [Pseudomonadota bacterium]
MSPARTMSRVWMSGLAWLLLLAASIAAIVAGVQMGSASPAVEVVVRMSKSTQGNVQLFTGTPAGYQEAHSVTLASAAPGVAHDYPLRLPNAATLPMFRVDPGSGPGRVVLHHVQVGASPDPVVIEGEALRRAVRPLKELAAEGSGEDVSFVSHGADPFLEVTVPQALLQDPKASQRQGWLLAATGLAGLLVLLVAAWLARERLRRIPTRGRAPKLLGLFALTALAALALLATLRTGCNGWCSAGGFRYGAALLLGSLAMATIGAAAMRITGLEARFPGLRLFLWIVVGQTALLVYAFTRSAVHAVLPVLPLTGTELGLLVFAAAVYLWSTRHRFAIAALPRGLAWAAIETALLVTVCLVIADRELPRLIMLSSDPDTHAFLARQVELLGGIPWRGEAVFHYPGGTAALGFLWAKLALLDVRNAVTALPLLQSFLAALMLGEALASRIRPATDRLLLMLTALGVTAAGFLIPLFASYSHMEGTGRQMAIATAAMVPALLMSGRAVRASADWRIAAMLLVALFAMAVLNPVSVVVPLVLAIAYAIHVAIARHRVPIWWLAAIAACPLLLLLDPYYFHLITGAGTPAAKITVSSAMPLKDVAGILASWQGHHLTRPWEFPAQLLAMSRGHAVPLFVLLVTALLGLLMIQHPRLRIRPAASIAIALAIFALAAAHGLFAALGDDRRFYLLAPYYAFSLLQLKILLVTALAASVMLVASVKRLPAWQSGWLAAMMVLMVYLGMHGVQKFSLEPRVDYCGSLGCLSADDLQVMRDLEALHRAGAGAGAGAASAPARVLVPNSVHDTAREDWVFPISGARALPFYDVPPVAFFYYQGDDDYTTENYKAHVCRRFDREWLKRQEIAYVFLPSVRGSACMQDMERLPDTEDVLIRHGNSYLLRLR